MSLADSIANHLHDLWVAPKQVGVICVRVFMFCCADTRCSMQGTIVSMGVHSAGNPHGIDANIFLSFPVTVAADRTATFAGVRPLCLPGFLSRLKELCVGI